MITYLKSLEVTLLGYSLYFLVSFFLHFALSSIWLLDFRSLISSLLSFYLTWFLDLSLLISC